MYCKSYIVCRILHVMLGSLRTSINVKNGKAVPLQTWTGPEVSRKLRSPDFVTTAQDGCRLSALSTDRLYPQEILLVLISVKRPSINVGIDIFYIFLGLFPVILA